MVKHVGDHQLHVLINTSTEDIFTHGKLSTLRSLREINSGMRNFSTEFRFPFLTSSLPFTSCVAAKSLYFSVTSFLFYKIMIMLVSNAMW